MKQMRRRCPLCGSAVPISAVDEATVIRAEILLLRDGGWTSSSAPAVLLRTQRGYRYLAIRRQQRWKPRSSSRNASTGVSSTWRAATERRIGLDRLVDRSWDECRGVGADLFDRNCNK